MKLNVEQALHGYSDGHRLIASSAKLSSVDSRAMLVMSDLSGSGVRPGPDGYLTGYPLDDAGKYVLSRTWAAPEMPRPGCVWTHSLLIDNADLAALRSTDGLLASLRRPEVSFARSQYGEVIAVVDRATRSAVMPTARARRVVNALYAAPGRKILEEADGGEDEVLALAIWMQQWPRLRRAFGFCTLAGMDRTGKGVSLDLQMTRSLDRQTRAKFPESAVPIEVDIDESLRPLFTDLSNQEDSSLREFLRRTGGDVDGGRRAMAPLCRLYTALFVPPSIDLPGAVSALTALDSSGARSARNVRTIVANRAIEQIGDVDDTVFDFVLQTFDHDTVSDSGVAGDSFSRALWLRAPERFLSMMSSEGPMARACRLAIEQMPLSQIVPAIEDNPSVAETVVSLRPDLLQRTDFWRISGVGDDLVRYARKEDAAKVAWALASAGRNEAAPALIEVADPGDLIVALEGLRGLGEIPTDWIQVLSRQPDRLAAALASGRIEQLLTVLLFARASEPDAVPNDYGDDPWIVALESVNGSIGDRDSDFLAAFMVARAFGGRSRSKAALLRLGYGRLYRALQQSRLPSDVARLVTWRLDWGSWFDWDNCSRLRETTVRHFVDGRLDPELFGRLTDDGALANSLIDEAARSGRGRRYLADVRHAIKRSPDKGMKARADYIAKKIK